MKKVLFLVLFSSFLYAEENSLTGNLRLDLFSYNDSLSSSSLTQNSYNQNFKNPALGGLYSLLIPGLGQFTSERYTKSAIFFAAEVALVTATILYNSKGNSKTTEFQNYADANWSAVRYVRWVATHGSNDYGGPDVTLNELLKDPSNLSPENWNNVNWEKLNEWESAQHSTGFTHKLPLHGEQQYYELIGKYHQYKFGWNDFEQDAQGVPISDNGNYDDLMKAETQIKSYSVERGKANDFYYIAGWTTAAIVINHVISAVDGYFSTMSYNKEISTELGISLQEKPNGEITMIPMLTVKVGL